MFFVFNYIWMAERTDPFMYWGLWRRVSIRFNV